MKSFPLILILGLTAAGRAQGASEAAAFGAAVAPSFKRAPEPAPRSVEEAAAVIDAAMRDASVSIGPQATDYDKLLVLYDSARTSAPSEHDLDGVKFGYILSKRLPTLGERSMTIYVRGAGAKEMVTLNPTAQDSRYEGSDLRAYLEGRDANTAGWECDTTRETSQLYFHCAAPLGVSITTWIRKADGFLIIDRDVVRGHRSEQALAIVYRDVTPR